MIGSELNRDADRALDSVAWLVVASWLEGGALVRLSNGLEASFAEVHSARS